MTSSMSHVLSPKIGRSRHRPRVRARSTSSCCGPPRPRCRSRRPLDRRRSLQAFAALRLLPVAFCCRWRSFGLLVVFGAPLARRSHARAGCRTACRVGGASPSRRDAVASPSAFIAIASAMLGRCEHLEAARALEHVGAASAHRSGHHVQQRRRCASAVAMARRLSGPLLARHSVAAAERWSSSQPRPRLRTAFAMPRVSLSPTLQVRLERPSAARSAAARRCNPV